MEEVHKQVRTRPRDKERDKERERRLERQSCQNTLDNHWADVRSANFNQPLSDFHYKHHVSRLMNTYTRPTGQVDHVLQPVSRVVKPVTQLYGVNGLRSNKPETVLKKREEGWHSRVDICEKLDSLSRKKFGLYDDCYKSRNFNTTSSGKDTRSHDYHDKEERSPDRNDRRSSVPGREPVKKPSRRADFDGISENDLIANGLYALTPQQRTLFNNFTDMITSFDNTDMIHILEDALEEAKSKTGLEDYDGFA